VLGHHGGISAFFATGYFRGADLATGARRHDKGFTRLSYLGKPLICPSAVIQRLHLPMIWGGVPRTPRLLPPTRLALTASQPVTMSRNRGNAHRQATGLLPDKMGLY
jgi:hypothetical protein